jgi:hypothetical protein
MDFQDAYYRTEINRRRIPLEYDAGMYPYDVYNNYRYTMPMDYVSPRVNLEDLASLTSYTPDSRPIVLQVPLAVRPNDYLWTKGVRMKSLALMVWVYCLIWRVIEKKVS